MAVVLRGYAVPRSGSTPLSSEKAAAHLFERYSNDGVLPDLDWEGSFTAILADGAAGRLLLYRNLVGVGFTYYAESPSGLVFSSNLARLTARLKGTPQVNLEHLPALFVYRYVPGADTLFSGIKRLMPGQHISFDGLRLKRIQRQTLGDLRESGRIDHGAADRINETLGQVLANCRAAYPAAATLLSGGVDSSLIQVHWNRACIEQVTSNRSFCLYVDHPTTLEECRYARSAADALGTSHTMVRARPRYTEDLIATISSSAETPHHVQSAYFGYLGSRLRDAGVATALCGQGADALFGLGSTPETQVLQRLRRIVPSPAFRRVGAYIAHAAAAPRFERRLREATALGNLNDLSHPLNRVGSFTSWPAVLASFGATAVAGIVARQRALLQDHRVVGNLIEQIHACDFLTDSTESAGIWDALTTREGVELVCPFLDSRIIRLALNLDPRIRFPYRKPKELLKKALARCGLSQLAYRPKLSFGQPIFEWLARSGQLRPLVDRISPYNFLDSNAVQVARETPNWFLYNLLCFDLWHKLFIEKEAPESLAPELACH
jgi:asparagine synthase (glutamine-hydrolysing)